MNTAVISSTIDRFKTHVLYLGELTHFVANIFSCLFNRPFYFSRLVDQIYLIGIGSISITCVIGVTMGLVMTLNFGHGLQKFGGTLYVPAVVSLSLAREMAPLFTSLLVAGRIGSGMAAEIGSMNVTQQIDAIRALGTSPIRVLVIPRVLASMISLPLLTMLSCALGILASQVICSFEFDIPYGFFINKVTEAVKIHDYMSGIVKSFIFAGIISIISCHRGLTTFNGTQGVGTSTTWVVVNTSILILITDFFISKIFIVFWT